MQIAEQDPLLVLVLLMLEYLKCINANGTKPQVVIVFQLFTLLLLFPNRKKSRQLYCYRDTSPDSFYCFDSHYNYPPISSPSSMPALLTTTYS